MDLQSGTQLGHYQILSPLAAGGMGEVYKARDPRLNRTVAIKVLPAHIAERPDLKQRFEREAQTVAGLNHPHICVVHDVGQHDGIDFIVMEYLEGETLADRIAKGPVPFDQLLTYGIQMADALDKAHRHGVTHRDLKPGNVMLTKTGLKLLDFGLAKVNQPTALSSPSLVPTMATEGQPLTAEGTLLGTLQYMSPEQLEGKEADARSDIFAFGSILYEMATGRRAFEGKSQVSLIAAILEHEPPPVSALQPVAPPLFDEVIKICLAKNSDDRWQSAADLLHELKLLVRYGSLGTPTAKGTRKREVAAWAAAAVLLIVSVSGFAFLARRDAPEPAKASFEVQTPAAPSPLHIALSPNGSHLAAIVPGESSVSALWVRPIEHLAGQVLPGTNNASFPFWSPDGRFIAFFADGKLKKVDIFGAPPQTLSDAVSGHGGTWNREGVILFAPTVASPLVRVAASGGVPTPVTELDKSREEVAHRHPHFLPDGIHFVYAAISSRAEESGIYLGSLNSKETRRLLSANVEAEFAPPNHLLFMRENTLMAQPFDPDLLELSGDPFPVVESVGTNTGNSVAGFTVSENGMLAYRIGGGTTSLPLLWIDRSGKTEGNIGNPGLYENPKLSPDGKRLAVFRRDGGAGDIWITDLERGNSSRFTFDAGSDNFPLWSPDGSRIVFASNRDGSVLNLYQKSSGGTGEDELLLKTAGNKVPTDWSADGRYILYEENDPNSRFPDLWVLPLSGDRKPIRFLATPFNENGATFSPDAHWIAYTSNETGRDEVYVQSFPATGAKWQISTNGGRRPRWRPDGKELFYDTQGGELWAADLTGTVPGSDFKAGTPQSLFTGLVNFGRNNYEVLPGGRRFLVLGQSQQTAGGPPPIVVVLNWKSGVTQ